jgi:IgA Peptidase M64
MACSPAARTFRKENIVKRRALQYKFADMQRLRRFWSIVVIVALLTAASPAVQASHITMVNNGPSSNRVDIVFLGDAYTPADLNTSYVRDIDSMLTHIFNEGQDPYPRYANFFNVHRINVVSNQQGADVPPDKIFRDTALDATYYFDGVTERLLYINESKANEALATGLSDASFEAEMRLVTVNDARYGGGGASYAVYAGSNSSATEVALHELGHSFNALADEYGGDPNPYIGPEPNEINVTTDPTGAKWAHWLGHSEPSFGSIGAYEGARYHDLGIFRPSVDSKMRTLGRSFDAISREKIVLDIYGLVDPLDSWLDNRAVLIDPVHLAIDVIDPTVIGVNWFVNGNLVRGATDETFRLSDFGFGPGSYEVTARAFDSNPDLVRINLEQLEQSITWNVVKTVPERSNSLTLLALGVLGLLGYAWKCVIGGKTGVAWH